MRLMTVSVEQDISALVRQVFVVPASSTARVSQAAVQALIDANPHLEGRTTIPAGTPIVVPDQPDLPPRAAEPEWTGTLDDIRTQAQQALAHARSVFENARKDAAQEAKDSLEVLRSRDFRALAGAANVSVESLTERVNNAAKIAQTQSTQDLKNLDALSRALDELMKAIGAST